jgi:SOS-response transcriptional repressors (RecA-mediated autopeptidases)
LFNRETLSSPVSTDVKCDKEDLYSLLNIDDIDQYFAFKQNHNQHNDVEKETEGNNTQNSDDQLHSDFDFNSYDPCKFPFHLFPEPNTKSQESIQKNIEISTPPQCAENGIQGGMIRIPPQTQICHPQVPNNDSIDGSMPTKKRLNLHGECIKLQPENPTYFEETKDKKSESDDSDDKSKDKNEFHPRKFVVTLISPSMPLLINE